MKVLFVCQPGSDNFAIHYLKHLTHNRIVARHAEGQIHAESRRHDVLWVEWANAWAERVLLSHPPCFTMIRIHDWEIRSKRVLHFNWKNVDAIWFINPDAKRDFCNLLPDVPESKMFVLGNALDLSIWPHCAHGDKHIGMVSANIQTRKRYDRAIKLMALLPDYHLTIRTSAQDHFTMPGGPQDMMALAKEVAPGRITFEFRNFTQDLLTDNSDVIDFWRDKSHVICTSEHEGFCYAFAEGMACGAAGATLRWDWGQPERFYDCVCDSLEDMAQRIRMTNAGIQNRIPMERFAAPTMASKLLQELELRI